MKKEYSMKLEGICHIAIAGKTVLLLETLTGQFLLSPWNGIPWK